MVAQTNQAKTERTKKFPRADAFFRYRDRAKGDPNLSENDGSRRRTTSIEGIDMVSQMILEMESQIKYTESIRDFVKDFRDQKITLKEFLAGPGRVEEEMEEMLKMMLGQLLGIKIER